MLHEAPVATVLAQVFDSVKSAALVPPIVMPLIESAEGPVFVRSATCDATGQLRFLQPLNVIATGTRFTVPLVSVTLAAAELAGWVAEAAVRTTARLAGSAAGALYLAGLPLAVLPGLTVPHAGEHGAPFWVSAQVTPLFAMS
jgi:hypothetical protein